MKPLDANGQPPIGQGSETELTAEQQARRRLLKMAVYVPPAVIGSLVIGRTAHAQAPSCGPASCGPSTDPCGPQTDPCGPVDCRPRTG